MLRCHDDEGDRIIGVDRLEAAMEIVAVNADGGQDHGNIFGGKGRVEFGFDRFVGPRCNCVDEESGVSPEPRQVLAQISTGCSLPCPRDPTRGRRMPQHRNTSWDECNIEERFLGNALSV